MQTRDISRSPRFLLAVVVGVTLATMLVAAVIGLLVRPGYTSTTQVYVAGSSKSGASGAVKQRVASYAALTESEQLASSVDRQLGLDGSPGDLQGRIHADVVPGTLLIRLQVTASSAASAQRTGKAVVQQLRGLAGSIASGQGGDNTIRVASGPSSPSARDARHVGRAVGIGLPIGLVLGLLAAIALALRPRRLDGREDVDAALDAPVLAEVTLDPSDGPTDPTEPSEPTDGFDQLAENVRFLGVDTHGPVVAVVSPDDTDGVETAVRLAQSLHRAGSSVLLVDADLRSGTIAARLGLREGTGLSNVLVGDVDLEHAVQTHPVEGLAVLTSGPLPPNPGELSGSAALRSVLTAARAGYRTVVVSTPARSDSEDVARLAAAADGALLVVRRGAVTQRGLKTAVRGVSSFGGAVLGVVLAQSTEPTPPPTPSATPEAAGVDGSAPAHDDVGEPTSAHSLLADPQPWRESGEVSGPGTGATTVGKEAGRDEAAEPADPWAILETPDNPEPFWVTADAGDSASAETATDAWPFDDTGETGDIGEADNGADVWTVDWPARPGDRTDDSATEETAFLTHAEMVAEVGAEPRPAQLDDDSDDWWSPATELPSRPSAEPAPETRALDAAQSPWLSTRGETWTPPQPPSTPDQAAPATPTVTPDPLVGIDVDRAEGAPRIEDWAARALGSETSGAEPIEATEWTDPQPVGDPDADDASVAEPARRGPLTAGELASISGEDDATSETASSDTGGVSSEESTPAQDDQESADGWLPGQALPDDEPWGEPDERGDVAQDQSWSEGADGLADPAEGPASIWTPAPDPLVGEIDARASDERTPTYDQTVGNDDDTQTDLEPAIGHRLDDDQAESDPDDPDDPDDDDQPRYGSLLDDFLTDDDADRDEDPADGPSREDRGWMWRPRRWLDS